MSRRGLVVSVVLGVMLWVLFYVAVVYGLLPLARQVLALLATLGAGQ